jgi:hypothetical protein
VKHFKKKYKQIFACGHSYGAPSLLFSKTDLLDGMAFWDGYSRAQPDIARLQNISRRKTAMIWRWGCRAADRQRHAGTFRQMYAGPSCGS